MFTIFLESVLNKQNKVLSFRKKSIIVIATEDFTNIFNYIKNLKVRLRLRKVCYANFFYFPKRVRKSFERDKEGTVPTATQELSH